MTDRIKEFLARNREDGPRLVVDLDVVRENYLGFAKALPDTRVFYAVKANPAPEILSLLADLGSCFDTASIAEIKQSLAAGATPDRISFGNTIKKEKDIARAYTLGIRLYAVDCEAEVEKVARAAPGSKVFCRILCDGSGAEWPLSRKFGCGPQMAARVLERAQALGLAAHGLSFHVGSQQRNPRMWDRALKTSAGIFRDLAERGVQLQMINLGGGFPTRYLKQVPGVRTYGQTIFRALRRHFGNRIPETIIEPGRGMVGNAGTDLRQGADPARELAAAAVAGLAAGELLARARLLHAPVRTAAAEPTLVVDAPSAARLAAGAFPAVDDAAALGVGHLAAVGLQLLARGRDARLRGVVPAELDRNARVLPPARLAGVVTDRGVLTAVRRAEPLLGAGSAPHPDDRDRDDGTDDEPRLPYRVTHAASGFARRPTLCRSTFAGPLPARPGR